MKSMVATSTPRPHGREEKVSQKMQCLQYHRALGEFNFSVAIVH